MDANAQWIADLPQATMATAFGRRAVVRIVERDGALASVVLPGGVRATVKWTSLNHTEPIPAVPAVSADPVTEPGMYEQDGTIFKVQAARETGNLYAKRLVVIGGKRLMDSAKVNLEFEYAPGAVKTLGAADRMTVEQAKAFGIEYGVCCVCGAFLKDADSVEAGIGPVCAKKV